MLAMVCGDVCIWKPSEKTPLCAVACQYIIANIFEKNEVPEGVLNLIVGDREVGEWMSNDKRIALLSATGSTKMGKAVSAAVSARLGRSLPVSYSEMTEVLLCPKSRATAFCLSPACLRDIQRLFNWRFCPRRMLVISE